LVVPDTYVHFWIYLTAPDADLLFQVQCNNLEWDFHRWSFSTNGTWEGASNIGLGTDFNLPQG